MKKKKHEVISISFCFALVAECLQLNDEFTCFTASPNLNAKKCWDCMQEGGGKKIALPKCTLSQNIGGRWTLSYYSAEVPPVSLHCRALPNISTLLSYTQS